MIEKIIKWENEVYQSWKTSRLTPEYKKFSKEAIRLSRSSKFYFYRDKIYEDKSRNTIYSDMYYGCPVFVIVRDLRRNRLMKKFKEKFAKRIKTVSRFELMDL